jgi:hypothetical protein
MGRRAAEPSTRLEEVAAVPMPNVGVPWVADRSSALPRGVVSKRLKQFSADCGCEELGVGAFGDGGVGVAEEFADRLEAEAPVDEVAAKGASEGVRAYGGSVLA